MHKRSVYALALALVAGALLSFGLAPIPNVTQAAAAAWSSGQTTYTLPAGASTLDQLTIPAGCSLEGNGAMVYPGVRDPSRPLISTAWGVRIRNLTVANPLQNAGTGDAIVLSGGGQVVEGVVVGSSDVVGGSPSFGRGIVVQGPFTPGRLTCETRITGCRVMGCTIAQYDVENESDGFLVNCLAIGSVPGSQGVGMMFGPGASGWQVLGNHVWGQERFGLYLAGSAILSRDNRIETGSTALVCLCGPGITMRGDVLWAVQGYAGNQYAAIQLGDLKAGLWAQLCTVDVSIGEFKTGPGLPRVMLQRDAEGDAGDYSLRVGPYGLPPTVSSGLHVGSVTTVKQLGHADVITRY